MLTWEQLDALPAEKTIALPKPIESPGGELVTELRLREPTALELEGMVGAKSITIISLNSGIPESVVGKIPARALHRAEDYLLPFIEGARTTGAPPTDA